MLSWCHGELQVREAYSKWWKIKVAESEFLSRRFGETLTISNLHTAPQVCEQYIFVICTLVFNLLICLFICRLPCELVLYHPLNLASVSCMWFTADCGSLLPSLCYNFNNWMSSTCQQLDSQLQRMNVLIEVPLSFVWAPDLVQLFSQSKGRYTTFIVFCFLS